MENILSSIFLAKVGLSAQCVINKVLKFINLIVIAKPSGDNDVRRYQIVVPKCCLKLWIVTNRFGKIKQMLILSKISRLNLTLVA